MFQIESESYMPLIFSSVVVATGIIVAAFLHGGRYETVAAGDNVFITDKFTGAVRSCVHFVGCKKLEYID